MLSAAYFEARRMTQDPTLLPPRGHPKDLAADDGDPHRIIEAAGKDNADQGGASVAGRERKGRRPLVRSEQSSPAERLERLGEEKEQRRRHEQHWVPARKRPGGRREVASGQQRERDRNRG